MPKAERRPIVQPQSEPGTPGDELVVDKQVEGVEAAPTDFLARAREAVVADGLPEQLVTASPEEEKIAPGYSEYVLKAWDFVKKYFTTEKPAATPEEQAKVQRRNLFTNVDEIASKLLDGKTLDVRKLIGQEVKIRTNTYRILRLLGNGGMGVVLVVENIQQPGKEYVMKLGHSFDRSALNRDTEATLPPPENPNFFQRLFGLDEPAPIWSQSSKDETTTARRHVVEVASLHKLKRHGSEQATDELTTSNTVFPELIDAQFLVHPDDRERRISAVVMEKIEGKTIYSSLGEDVGLDSADDIINYARQLIDGVQYMHDAGVLHLDLKPENVLVTPEGKIVFVDFGLSDVDKRKPNNIRPRYANKVPGDVERSGTQRYYVQGEGIGPARDWYAVGRTIHDMIYGTSGSANTTERIEMFRELSPELRTVSRAAEGLVTRDARNRKSGMDAKRQMETELAEGAA